MKRIERGCDIIDKKLNKQVGANGFCGLGIVLPVGPPHDTAEWYRLTH